MVFSESPVPRVGPKHQTLSRSAASDKRSPRAPRLPLANAHTVVSAHTNRSPCLSSGASRAARSASRAARGPRSRARGLPLARLAPRRRMCFSPPPDPRGSARAAPPLATARDARARRAPFPRILDAARAPGRRAFSPPRPRPDRAATVASKPSSHADPRRSVSFLRSTDARLRSTAGEPPSLTVSSSFRFFSTAFTSPRATSRSSTRSSTTSSVPAAG